MKIQPLFDRVLIEPEENEHTTKSGIILPQTSQERPQIAKVVAVGSGKDFDNNEIGMQVKVGDKVLFNKFSGVEIKFDEKVYIVIRQIDLIAIINEWLT